MKEAVLNSSTGKFLLHIPSLHVSLRPVAPCYGVVSAPDHVVIAWEGRCGAKAVFSEGWSVAPRGSQSCSLPGANGLHATVSESVLSLWSLKTSSKSCETLTICGGLVVPLRSPRDCPVSVPQVYVTLTDGWWWWWGAAFGNVLPMLCLREQ